MTREWNGIATKKLTCGATNAEVEAKSCLKSMDGNAREITMYPLFRSQRLIFSEFFLKKYQKYLWTTDHSVLFLSILEGGLFQISSELLIVQAQNYDLDMKVTLHVSENSRNQTQKSYPSMMYKGLSGLNKNLGKG